MHECLEPAKSVVGFHCVPFCYCDIGQKSWFQRAGRKAMETHTCNSDPSQTDVRTLKELRDNLEDHGNTAAWTGNKIKQQSLGICGTN